MGERSACGMYSRSSFTKPMSSLFHASGLRVRIDTVCPASAASAAKMGVELPPPTTVMCMLLRPVRRLDDALGCGFAGGVSKEARS